MPNKNFTMIDNNFIDSEMKNLKPTSVLVYLVLFRLKNNEKNGDEVFPSYTYIQKVTGLSRPTISSAIDELSAKGYIKSIHKGYNTVNHYHITDNADNVDSGASSKKILLPKRKQVVKNLYSGSKKSLLPVVKNLNSNNTNINILNNNTAEKKFEKENIVTLTKDVAGDVVDFKKPEKQEPTSTNLILDKEPTKELTPFQKYYQNIKNTSDVAGDLKPEKPKEEQSEQEKAEDKEVKAETRKNIIKELERVFDTKINENETRWNTVIEYFFQYSVKNRMKKTGEYLDWLQERIENNKKFNPALLNVKFLLGYEKQFEEEYAKIEELENLPFIEPIWEQLGISKEEYESQSKEELSEEEYRALALENFHKMKLKELEAESLEKEKGVEYV